MVRSQVRKTDIGTTSSDRMAAAASSVVSKEKSLNEAALEFGIPKTTLFRYVAKLKYTNNDASKVRFCPNYAVNRVLNDEDESMLADYLLTASKLHYGLTPKASRELAFEFAQTNNKPVPSSWVLNQTAGEDWFYGFMSRHKQLSLRAPQSTSLSRSTAFNKTTVSRYFDNLEDVVKRYKFNPCNIYNVDETGVTTVHTPNKIVAGKGTKQVGKITSAERGTLVTVCCATNAIGNAIPPFFIFPRVYFKHNMLHGAPTGSHGSAHPSGWMTSENFQEFLKHFVSYAKCSVASPVLMLLDNHDSHVSVVSIDYAKQNGIVLLTFPPHCSHKLQPLDRAVYGPLKKFYNSSCDSWMLANPGKPMTIYDIAGRIGEAFPLAATPTNIVSGFRVSGNWPINRNIFTEDEYMTSYVTDRPLVADDNLHESASTSSAEKADKTPQPSTSTTVNNKCAAATTAAVIVTPEQIKPYPKAGARKSTNQRQKGKSRILTDTPVKVELEQQALKRKQKGKEKTSKNLVNKNREKKQQGPPSKAADVDKGQL